MAETKAVATYESIMRDIKARKFSPIYILMGDESYFIDKICAAIMESVLPEEEREFNQFVVFGSDVSAGHVALLARELPMMSEYKVVVVKLKIPTTWKNISIIRRHRQFLSIVINMGTLTRERNLFRKHNSME